MVRALGMTLAKKRAAWFVSEIGGMPDLWCLTLGLVSRESV